MESIYDKRFKTEMDYIRKCLNKFAEDHEKIEPDPFYIYVYQLYLKDFKNNRKTAETKLLNVLCTLNAYSPHYGYYQLFSDFLNGNYNSLDLNCFLLLRFMILRDIEAKNEKIKFKKQKYHLHNFEIDARQGAKYLIEMFKDCAQINIESILKSIFPPEVSKMQAYVFLILAIREYKEIREGRMERETTEEPRIVESPQITESLEYFETQKSEKVDLIPKLKEHMEFLIDKFIQSLSKEDLPMSNSRRSLIDIRDVIFSKLDNLLSALEHDNQEAWFKELLIEYPDEDNIEQAKELFGAFNQFSKGNVDDDEKLREFCKKILKVPEVNNQISSLLTYFFGNDDSEGSEPEYYSESKQYESKKDSQAYESSKLQEVESNKRHKFETFRSPQYESYDYKNAYIKEVAEELGEEDEDRSEHYDTYGSRANSNLFLN